MLKRKMFRDIKNNLSQFITIFLMVCIGIMAYSGIESYMKGMTEAANVFYKENNLQDLDVYGVNLQDKDVNKIKQIKNVKNAEKKFTIMSKTDTDDTLKLSFIDTNNISKIYVREGNDFKEDTSGIWLDNFYAIENNISVNDKITLKFDGYEITEKVQGLINVPDHLFDTKDETELIPNRKEFGFAYLSTKELKGYIEYKIKDNINIENIPNFNYKDYIPYNSIMVDVNKKSNVKAVKKEIEKQIPNNLAVLKIEDEASYKAYQGEIDEGKSYVGIFSGLFIFIAMLSVITTMTRIVKKERVQIGTLKALGFKNKKIISHYISYGLIVSIFGVIYGLILGYILIGNIFMNIEMSFFEMPNGKPVMEPKSYLVSLFVILIVSIASYFTCRKILKLNAAETLRNDSPNVNTKELNMTTAKLFDKMSFDTKWNIRDMLRNKLRTITAIVGIAGCTTLIVCGFGMFDSISNYIKVQFEDLYNFKYKLTLDENIAPNELKILTDKYGKSTIQHSMIEIEDDDKNKLSNTIEIVDDNDENMIRFLNKDKEFIKLKSNGIYVTNKLAETRGYKIGDTIKWHEAGSNKYYESKIVGFNREPQNQNVTMTRKYYEKLGNEYKPNALYTNKNLKNVKEIDNVKVIQNKAEIKKSMDLMINNMKSMLVLIILIAIILGVVIIYNMGVLSYTEKQYQYSTLKVLGFKDKKIKRIFIHQNNIITMIAIIIGLPLGFVLVDYIYKAALDETYDIYAYIKPISYLLATIGTLIVNYIVSSILGKKIKKIDMVSSLKGNE